MKTLVFCTTYAEHRAVWDMRHAWWLKALQSSQLEFDQLLMVDDASPELPDWPGVKVIRERDAPDPRSLVTSAQVVLYTHEARLGRASVFDFPGWHRSFAFAARYAHAHGFRKVIHLESDAFIVSSRMQQHFNDVREGWTAPWSSRYTFPEIALQVAAGRDVARMAAFAERPYTEMAGRLHESALPYTHVEKSFVGDRYGEFRSDVPHGVDFIAQGLINQPADYYWWMGEPRATGPAGLPPAAPPAAPLEALPPFDVGPLDGDWSGPEDGQRWMTGWDSALSLPPVQAVCDHLLELSVAPSLSRGPEGGQRVYVLVNDRLLTETLVLRPVVLQFRTPASWLSAESPNRIRLLHPDGTAPSTFDEAYNDGRELSIALRRLALTPLASPARPVKVQAGDRRGRFFGRRSAGEV